MKRRYKIVTAVLIIMLAISMGINIVAAVTQNAEPGSEQDPIVSKSYVDAAISQMTTKIQSLLEQIDTLKTQYIRQENTIKALQAELNAVKTGTPGTSQQVAPESGGSGSETLGTGVIKAAVVNLRAKPTTSSAIVGKLLLNNQVTLISKTGNWYQVKTSAGKTGYIREDLLTVKK